MAREWELRALCRTRDPDLWFSDSRAAKAEAKAVCRVCPVRDEYLAAALRREDGVGRSQRWGIVAALSGSQRWDLAHKPKAPAG